MGYIQLEDSYEDIKGATLDTLNRNKDRYNLPINQAVAYLMHESEGIFEENEFEKTVTLIPVGIFLTENKYKHKILKDVENAIKDIESNKYDNLFLNTEDKNQIEKDIQLIKDNIKALTN